MRGVEKHVQTIMIDSVLIVMKSETVSHGMLILTEKSFQDSEKRQCFCK
jgi:hypothetical protein